ncbi:MAG: ABC transporter substrate-binding protein [Myxococcales bacterium]|nr:ABC transporter substrate-binding protein [Myxococcales bacterium]
MALNGNLSETSFTDLIQFYSISRQTAAVTIVSPAGPDHDGILYIESGDVVHARFGELEGIDAVRRALRLKEGEFHVELNKKCQERTIFEPWSKLVLEEMCAEDEFKVESAALDIDVEPPEEQPMPTIANDLKEGPRYCPVCNRRYRSGTVCVDDGAQLITGTPAAGVRTLPKTVPPPPPPSRRGLYIGLGAAVLVIGAAAGFLLWQRAESERQARAAARAAEAAAMAEQPKAAKPSAVQGVTDTEITLGMSAPFSGPAKELGRGMKTGIDIAFAAANDAGGVNGRKLKLVALDDGYEPDRTTATMKELNEKRQVFGFIGNVGTPTAQVAVPYALEKKMIFFGPFTGAGLLRRDPPDRYVFNYRASYAEETAAAMKYLVEIKRIKPHEIAVFAQQDGYGDAGFNGVAKMMRKYDRDPAQTLRVGYQRNTSEVQAAVDGILGSRQKIKAIVMVPAYKPAAKFIEKVRAERPDMIFSSVSFVGAQALADELMSAGPKFAEGVIVTQVVPLPTSKSTAVLKYQELLPKYSVGEKPDFVSLEGYLAAQLMIEGLKRAGRDVTMETFVDALEGMKGIDLGVGATMSFGMSEHQASHKVWGTILDASGNIQPLELE